jgi:DhnA family fructose-bisphosphate aldolase class Ia
MDAGAMGVTFGRNIFQHESPRRIVRLLRKIVIDGMGVEQVLEEPV